MRTLAHGLIAGLLGWALTSTLVACSDEMPPGSTSGATSGQVPQEAGPARDAGPLPAGDAATCQDAGIAGGEEVNEVQLAGDEPPPLGGTIQLGTYVLNELQVYVPYPANPPDDFAVEKLTGKVAAKNVVLGATIMELVGAEGTPGALGQTKLSGGTYATSGAELRLDLSCPTQAVEKLRYSAAGSGLVLYVGGRREVYKRSP